MLRARIRNSISSFQKVGGTPPFSFDNALKFDGVDDYVSFPAYTLNGTVTFNFWVNFDVFKNFNTFFGHLGTLSNYSYILSRNANNISLFSGSDRSFTVPTMSLNTWYMITITRDVSNVWKVYQNGVKSANEYTDSNNYPYSILGSYSTTSNFLDGKLDEVAIWNTELNSTQISNLWANGDGDYATKYLPANLIAYWRMNGTSGDSTAIDEQGNYNGTLTNFNTSTCWVAH